MRPSKNPDSTEATLLTGRFGVRRNGRPGRRLALASLAVGIAAGALSIGSGPAQAVAADVQTDRLRGATRYETAVAIAEAFVDEIKDGSFGGEVDTVILTSGVDEHFGYVLPAPALSRRRQAPVLLTEPDELPGAVRRFIVSHGFVEVVILGGGDVVSAEVEREVDGLSGVSVERIAGRDVYATAVEVAKKVGPSIRFPGRFSRTVLLATGETFADALAAGPLAYVGPHAMLLTRGAAMSQELVDFLEDGDSEHVVILGGFDAVSLDVQLEIEDLDIAVTRWRGVTRFETAIEIAKVLLAGNWPPDCFVGAEVGLAYAWRSPDAIVSGPYLGELCAPLLLVGRNVLPEAVEDVLAADGLFVGDSLGGLRITAFGGTAAVSGSVLRSAANAAELASLSARVSAVEGGCHFTVTFDGPVLTVYAENPRYYVIIGELADLVSADVEAGFGEWTSQVTVTFDDASTASGAAVPTGCPSPLRVGDTVGVAAQRIRSATDRRTVERVEFRVRADNARPRLTITAVQDATTVEIRVSEPVTGTRGAATIEVEFRRSGLEPVVVVADVTPGATRIFVPVPAEFDTANTTGLSAQDQVIVGTGEIEDLAGNGNQRTAKAVL
ncbi:cell wall-binding repeat-containing protein [Candidatus Poriferisodalis sp.]|uniref:cell wall-binding repeat-containing protein n=1 Tax=Candidatus Poriferisodalis sp. TaxID=3101277 RepID=UPI003B0214E0